MGAPRFILDQIAGWSNQVGKDGGVIMWDVPIQRSGFLAQEFLDQLAADFWLFLMASLLDRIGISLLEKTGSRKLPVSASI